jgi:hypothetical protein
VCLCGAGAACTAGLECCGASCIDVETDENNCGECGNVCGTNSTCNAGRCECSSPTFANCDGDFTNGCEINVQTDSGNCGGCGTSCVDQNVASGSCSAGSCVISACTTLYDDCDRNPGNGCEVDLRQVSNCGSCGNVCMAMGANARCSVSGSTASCSYDACMGSRGDCDANVMNGCETDLRTSTPNCGGCGQSCLDDGNVASATCSSSSCNYTCTVPFADCTASPGCETNTQTSAQHCGGCGNSCLDDVGVDTATCSGGMCNYVCRFPNEDCTGAPGCETNTTTSVAHCGACMNDCRTHTQVMGATCSGSTCSYTCNPGFLDCTAAPGCETAVSVTNCGSCGNDCTDAGVDGATCSSGTCGITSCDAGLVNCDGMVSNGCEAMPTDMNCCGTNCPGAQMCQRRGNGAMPSMCM